MSSKKTVLKETPNLPAASQQKVKRKNDYLRECIGIILRKELLHLNVKKVFDILANDLHISLKNVTPRMKYVLSECLCYYMKMWPGWQKYDVVCVNERAKMDYIEKFKEYLAFKIRYIIENEKLFNPNTLGQEGSTMVSQEIQTDPINKRNKPEAPYNLVISGQPNVLNNIVFIEMDNNIVIKQHAEKPWKPLNVAEFLNYSFVYVSIKLPDLELSRSNLHEFQRYITECGDTASCPDVDFITYVRKRSGSAKPKVYSMDYIHAYCKQFIDTIKIVPGINAVKITELEEVFRQFILDIQESNVFSYTNSVGSSVNTMATQTTVCFNIGGKTYIRNKKMVVNTDNQKESNPINFCEVLIPRMAYTLDKFIGEEDTTTEDTSFKSLNQINVQVAKNPQELYKFVEAINSSVTYHCLLCPKVYSGDRAYIDILDHYRFLHKGEQSVLCFTCRKQFAIAKLAGARWCHECGTDATTETAKTTDTIAANTANTTQVAVTTHPRPAIGINDILTGSKSSISVDDLVNNQGGGAPSVGDSLTKANSTSTVATASTLTTAASVAPTAALPVVRVATTNSLVPTFSYNTILAIAPPVSSYLASDSISIPNSSPVPPTPLITSAAPLIATSTSLIAAPPTSLIATTSTSLVTAPQNSLISGVPLTFDGISDIKTEVNLERDNIPDANSVTNSNVMTSAGLTMPILPVGGDPSTSILLAPIIAAPIDSVGNAPPTLNTNNMNGGSLIGTASVVGTSTIVPTLTDSLLLSHTLP